MLFVLLIRLYLFPIPFRSDLRVRQHLGSLAYATFLFLLATVGFCLHTWLNHRAFVLHRNDPGGPFAYIMSTSKDAASLAITAM